MHASHMFVVFTFVAVSCAPNDPPPVTASTAAPAAPANPDRRLTHSECTRGVEHAIALFDAEPAMADAAKVMRDGRDRYIAQCEAVATERDHDCLMKSRTSHELGLCPQPGAR